MENKNVEYYLFNINEKLKYKHKALFHFVLEGILLGFLYYIEFPVIVFPTVGLLVFIYFIFILILLSRATKDFDYKVENKTTKMEK